jgi:hypothetical protein
MTKTEKEAEALVRRILKRSEQEEDEETIKAVAAKVARAIPKREHISSPDCWCEPEEIEDGVWIHHQIQ